ncbi:O-fucosyltransferase family protein [Forsythia ovata]|uniref:O-fucosyltransferase family protein n=1 Tax=Forsythia ovata TaxID=205694 RepID=A0ABD1WW78_9LAMI
MAVDLRQVMAAILTFSMFIMLGNMVKRDHIDPLLESVQSSQSIDQYNASKAKGVILTEVSYGPWKDQNEVRRPCWEIPSFKGKQSSRYVYFFLSNGPEYHASQIANAVVVARHLGATLMLPDIRGTKLGEKRDFGEIYDVKKFVASLNGVVQVAEVKPAEVSSMKFTAVRVPDRVSEDFITSKIEPIFRTKRYLRLVTYFDSLSVAKSKETMHSNAYQCLATFGSLKLQAELQDLVDSMVGTLRSMSQTTGGRFVAVDLRIDMLGKKRCQENVAASKRCYNAEEIGEFLKKIGFHKETTIYLTQTGWHSRLDALRNIFPNTFTKDAIVPADERAKFMGSEGREYEQFVDFSICTQGDVFVPAYPSRFYASVAGNKIASGKTQIFVPAEKTSEMASDYLSPE